MGINTNCDLLMVGSVIVLLLSLKGLVLHGRDIKGANILVDPHGEIKLADFGMAKHVWFILACRYEAY